MTIEKELQSDRNAMQTTIDAKQRLKMAEKRHFDFSLFRGKLLRCVKFNVFFLVVAQPLLQADMLVGLLINSSSHMFKSQKIVYRLIKYHYKIYTIDCRPENFFY